MKEEEKAFHRRTAARCFNEAWVYLDRKKRSAEQDRRMLTCALASRFHWGLVGTLRNKAVGDWQISRVYAALKNPELALLFARSSVETASKYQLVEVLPSAHEGLARAYAVAGEKGKARKSLAAARKALDAIEVEKEDREIYLGQMADTEKLIGSAGPEASPL